MRRPLILLLTALFALATMGQESCDTATEPEKVPRAQNADEDSDRPSEPAAEITGKCDYLLGDYRFVGSADIANTGSGPVRVRVTATWEQLGERPIRQRKTVTVREGDTRRVRFKVPATVDQISAHQSADGECKVRGKIVS